MAAREPLNDPRAPLRDDLARAIAADAIEVAFQPQFACGDDRIVGAEALARWRHERLGAINGTQLFALADSAGVLPALSQRVWERALAEAGAWPGAPHLSLNVTAGDLARDTFAADFLDTLAQSGFPAQRLVLEITETALIANVERAAASLAGLAALGVTIALDDFGAGFCNFRYLKLLPLSGLKLDRSMVEGIAEDARDLAVLRGVLAMAHALGLAVTAEGIESAAQRDVVAAEGCARWQGFLGAEPMAGAEFLRLI